MDEGTLLNNRYQLLEQLGSGGMAEVFRARDLMLDRNVAIKILRRDFSGNEDFQNNFKQEARAAANLSHPNIVTVHDFGFAEDMLYIVMEYIPGKDLKQLIRERGRFTVEDAIPLIFQACAGIGYAHRAGLVHCDVKPHNMLVSSDGRLKVTDFGIARALSTILPGEKTDIVWGSPLYFSPEQAKREAPSPASDVYSLGVVLYELLSGTPPFTAGSADELARLHISARPIPIREYLPDIPTALEEIIMKVLSKEPAARYRTADQLGRVLKTFGTQRDIPVPQKQPAPLAAVPPEISTKRHSLRERSSVVRAESTATRYETPEPAHQPDVEIASAFEDIDFVFWGLLFVAMAAVLGLFPFWFWVFLAWFPPIR